MKHFWIAFIIFTAVVLLAGHGILKAWNRQIKAKEFQVQTERWELMEYICSDFKKRPEYSRAYIFGDQTIKCDEVIKDYVPTQTRSILL